MRWHELNSEELVNEANNFLAELQTESDRGCALVGTAVLDELLKEILAAFLVDGPTTSNLLNGAYAPLGSFSARINNSYSLGLISDHEFKHLEILRKVRNEFAHKGHGLTFKSNKITDLCAQIKSWFRIGDMTEEESQAEFMSTWGKTPKLLFIWAVGDLHTRLLFRPRQVIKEKRAIKDWWQDFYNPST